MKYKDYIGTVEYSDEDKRLYGKLLGIKDAIMYEANSVAELEIMFKQSVDTYLEKCILMKETPQKPCKGSFNVRISPELHLRAAAKATELNVSLNKVVADAIQQYCIEKDN